MLILKKGENAIKICFYSIAYLIAKNKRPYTEGEDIIKPIIDQVTKILSAEDKSINRRIMEIPMSDNTMARRTQEIFDDIQIQIAQRLLTADLAYSLSN